MQRNRLMSFATPDDRSLESELEVHRGTEGKHLSMHPGAVRQTVPLKAADKEVITHGPQQPGQQKNMQRLYSVDPERIYILCVIRPGHRPTCSRPKPRILLASGDLMAQQVKRRRRLNQSEWILFCDRANRNSRLGRAGGIGDRLVNP